MLKTILSPETCAACRNCCIFEEQSAWELPSFAAASAERLAGRPQYRVRQENGRIRVTLPYDDTHTAQPCPFLDPASGCTLPAEEKPFACSVWPLRLMKKPDGSAAIALYQGCPGVPDIGDPAWSRLLDGGLRERIFAEAERDPSLILPYHPNYRFLEQEEYTMPDFPQPQAVYRYFTALAAIPHGSGNTAGIRKWALDTAAKLGLSAHADETGNVIIRKDGSAGYEDHPRVILQGHLDMVCAQLPDCKKDMTREGLDLVWTADSLSADGTTLGGDDGIAVAYAFAVLESDSIPHPPLTVILTVDEETGMDGATGLSPEELDGVSLINIDSEEEGVFTVGCAGGVRSHLRFPVMMQPVGGDRLTVSLSGLTGGHSGAEIHKPLLNANAAVLELLSGIAVPFSLAELAGGVRDNVIPTECRAVLYTDDAEAVGQSLAAGLERLKAAYPGETGIRLEISAEQGSGNALSAADTKKLLNTLNLLPNGVQEMNTVLNMPETSLNLGIFELRADAMLVDALIRSGVNAKKEQLAKKLCQIAENAGGSASESGNYPAWEYRPGTALEQTAVRVFTAQYGKAPQVVTIHAGLECGILSDKAPQLACISVGPDIYDIHTPRETLSLPSVQRTWDFLCALLKEL